MQNQDLYETVSRLRRVARRIHLEAARAAPALAGQLRALAERYEAEADALEPSAATVH